MYIAKLLVKDGSVVWKMNYGATDSSGAGVETVYFTSDGGFVVGGYVNSDSQIKDILFKSGGIVDDGIPFIGKISASDAESSEAPQGFEWTYEDSNEYEGSAKMMRVDSDDNVVAILG